VWLDGDQHGFSKNSLIVAEKPQNHSHSTMQFVAVRKVWVGKLGFAL
jgi:hypothetical protein